MRETFKLYITVQGLDKSWAEGGLGLIRADKLYTHLYNTAYNRFLDLKQGGRTTLRALEIATLTNIHESEWKYPLTDNEELVY